MTLQEYLNQTEPKRNVKVYLNNDEFKIIVQNTSLKHIVIPLLQEKTDSSGEYVQSDNETVLYCTDSDGNKKGRSVFHVPRQITVGQFICKYGIHKLKDYPVRFGNIMAKINVDNHDLKHHSRRHFNHEHKTVCEQYRKVHNSEYFDHYHKHGSYRFYAEYTHENDTTVYAHWIYPADLVDDLKQPE